MTVVEELKVCKCQCCKTLYSTDFNVPDDLWSQISPSSKNGKGLMCPRCIGEKIELVTDYTAFKLVKI